MSLSSAVERGDYRLEDQLGPGESLVTMTGVMALLRAPLDVCRDDAAKGIRTAGIVCGYRGSPLGTVDMTYAAHRPVFEDAGIRFVNGVNEELAATVLWGAQQALSEKSPTVDGVVGLWYGKAPGLDRAGDAIRHASLAGVRPTGGVVLAVGDDPECKSSTVPSATEWTLADLAVPTLQPATVQEVLDLGRHAYAMSRRSGSWVGLKMHADIADGYATVETGRPLLDVSPFEVDGRIWHAQVDNRMFAPWSLELEHEAMTLRLAAAQTYARAAGVDRTIGASNADVGIVAAGKLYGDTVTALGRLGLRLDDLESLGIRVYKPALVWPLDPEGLREFASGLREIVVIEEKRAFIEDQIRAQLYGTSATPALSGLRGGPDGAPLLPAGRILDVEAIAVALRRRLETIVDATRLRQPRIRLATLGLSDVPPRTPYFCSGCPHNRSTVVPEGSIAAGGIGCHGMALFTRGRAVGTTQMGGEGAQWVGTSLFCADRHRFQNMGDGTLAHSGFLAVRQAVAAGTNITFKILANGVVAMTGGQRAAGELSIPALTRQLDAEGVRRIAVISDDIRRSTRGLAPGVRVRRRDRLDEVQRELRDVPGVTALIYDQACAAELRRERKRGRAPTPSTRPMINEAVCEGCGDCGDVSNCLSVHPVDTPFGRKTRIHQDSCNLDMSCVEGECPAFVTVEARNGARLGSPVDAAVDATVDAPIDEPVRPSSATILLAGIGGTGVVTVGQVLAAAANIDGLVVSSVDQTGMAQKGGPVLSHLRVGDDAVGGAARIEPGRTDAYLVFDLLTAVGDVNLARLSDERTVVVASTTITPTGGMVADATLGVRPSVDVLRALLDERSRSDENLYFDGEAVAKRALGVSLGSNFVMVGAAYQRGLLPMSAVSIERAIELNGVAVGMNSAAFRLGRRIGAGVDVPSTDDGPSAPAMTPGVAGLIDRTQPDATLYEVLSWRVPELIAYQDVNYAGRYVDAVARARAAELLAPQPSSRFSTVVAERLFHLMAYKDEYEVARLHRRPEFRAQVERDFGPRARVTYLLQPPLATRFGLRHKIRLGHRVAGPCFWALAKMKRLRGTPVDPFGMMKERRAERVLVGEYVDLVTALEPLLVAGRGDEAVRLAGLVSSVRGFGSVRERNLSQYRSVLDDELNRVGIATSS